jgi:hypothetical protein
MGSFQYPWDTGPPSVAPKPPDSPKLPDSPKRRTKPRGRRPASVTRAAARADRVAADWLYHHLTISGPAETVAAFAAAARGSGVIPWQLDFAAIEEDVFVRAVSQSASRRTLTVEGCRILARQFRERVEARQARAVALVGHSRACPFDLHVLLPVPASILLLGPAHPTSLAWLTAHWGITDRPRQVVLRQKPTAGRRLSKGHTVIGYGFFSHGGVAQGSPGTDRCDGNRGETPRVAIAQLAARWPELRFSLVPRPAD